MGFCPIVEKQILLIENTHFQHIYLCSQGNTHLYNGKEAITAYVLPMYTGSSFTLTCVTCQTQETGKEVCLYVHRACTQHHTAASVGW